MVVVRVRGVVEVCRVVCVLCFVVLVVGWLFLVV